MINMTRYYQHETKTFGTTEYNTLKQLCNVHTRYTPHSMRNFENRIAFSCNKLTMTTIRFAKSFSKPCTFNESSLTSPNDTDVNGILMLFSICARLNSKLLRRSMTQMRSGQLVSSRTVSFALIRGHSSFCKSLNSNPDTSQKNIFLDEIL